MRKFLLTLIWGIILTTFQVNSQIVIKIANIEYTPSTGQASVDVTADGFTNLVSAQFSINYDSLVLQYGSVSNLNTTLGLSQSMFSGPNGNVVKKGQMTFSWNDPGLQAKTLPNGARLFSINFNVLGAPCTTSPVTQSSVPLSIEYVNGSFSLVTNYSSVPGSVKVKCDNGGGGVDPCPDVACTNPQNLIFRGDTLTAKTGNKICIPFTVKNYKNMQGGLGTFSWDTTQLKFDTIKHHPTLNGTLYFRPPTMRNVMRYSWFNNSPDMPVTLPDNTVLFELCFEVLAPAGTNARICMGKVSPPAMDWSGEVNGSTVSVPYCVIAGTVLVRDVLPAPPVKIQVAKATGFKGSTVCLDVKVENFTTIRSVQYSMTWDQTKLKYVSTGMYGLQGLSAGNFNFTGTALNLTWNTGNNSVITLNNGHRIYQVCFELTGSCDMDADVNIIDQTPLKLEITGDYQGNTSYIFPVEITKGTITIECSPTGECTILGKTPVTCNGGSDGAVTARVVGPSNSTGCMCVWKNSAGTAVYSSADLSKCDLTGQKAGNYTLELVCNGVVLCSKSNEAITQPNQITIPGTGITNISCTAQKGSINVTGITGGNPPYNVYTWNPNIGNISNPGNLDVGMYSLTVTDSKGCTGTQTFEIKNLIAALSATVTGTNVTCKGTNNGKINVTPSGGCLPYNIQFPGGINPNMVAPGTYVVTITDSSVPQQTFTASAVTITEPASALDVNGNVTDADAAVDNGSISLIISGGTPAAGSNPYTIAWQGPTNISQNTNPATNLLPGNYNVTITDANGCTVIKTFTVGRKTNPMVTFDNVRVSTNFNGFGVACFGDCTATVSGTVTAGNMPVTINLKNGNTVVKTATLTVAGNFEFAALCAATYTVEFSNSAGVVTSSALTILAPSKLTSETQVNCTDSGEDNGSIALNLNNSGTAPYTYQWVANGTALSETGNKVEDAGKGTYGVTITDLNSCKLIIPNIDIKFCALSGECGTGSLVLTPDGNGQNDVFTIQCADDLQGTLFVFDRWGREVFSQKNYDNLWAGLNADNKELSEGAYIWVYEVNYGNGLKDTFKGTVTILK